jgi:hypothetical protein
MKVRLRLLRFEGNNSRGRKTSNGGGVNGFLKGGEKGDSVRAWRQLLPTMPRVLSVCVAKAHEKCKSKGEHQEGWIPAHRLTPCESCAEYQESVHAIENALGSMVGDERAKGLPITTSPA